MSVNCSLSIPFGIRWSRATSVFRISEAQSTHCGPAKLRDSENADQVCAEAILIQKIEKTHLHKTDTLETVLVRMKIFVSREMGGY